MDGECQEVRTAAYQSPKRAQVWFLQRSRRTWKRKYVQLKTEQKRLLNRVHDVTKSRAKWHDQAQSEAARALELAAENAALRQELEDLKKRRNQRGG
jgi:hypothetical protein